jgi:hypothetical protein
VAECAKAVDCGINAEIASFMRLNSVPRFALAQIVLAEMLFVSGKLVVLQLGVYLFQ